MTSVIRPRRLVSRARRHSRSGFAADSARASVSRASAGSSTRASRIGSTSESDATGADARGPIALRHDGRAIELANIFIKQLGT